MNESTKTKKALRGSLLALFLCIVLLIGTTFAWFTDTASTGVNKIQSGKLDVELQYNDNGTWTNAENKTLEFKKAVAGEEVLWEPGCTYELPELRVVNKGNLALKYKIQITGIQGDEKLNEAIDWTIGDVAIGNDQKLAPNGTNDFTIKGHMKEEAGNDYQGLSIDGITITVVATQDTVENDSFNNQYDKDATYPEYTVTDAASFIKAAKEGGIITVSNNIDPNKAIVANGTVQLDMNGKTLENTTDIWGDADDQWSLVSAQNKSNLTIDGNGTFKAKENDCYAVDVQDGSTVVIKNGTFVGNIHAVYVHEGTAIIEGGTYSVQQKYPDANKADGFVLNCYDKNRADGIAKIIVKGGTFINFNPADCWAEGEHTNFVADGYKVTSEKKGNDTYYTVVKK